MYIILKKSQLSENKFEKNLKGILWKEFRKRIGKQLK